MKQKCTICAEGYFFSSTDEVLVGSVAATSCVSSVWGFVSSPPWGVTLERSYELPSEAAGVLSGMLSGLEGIPKAPSADGANGGASFPRAQGTKAS